MTEGVHVEVLLFARLREVAGRRAVEVTLPADASADDLWTVVVGTLPVLRGARGGVRVAINERYAAWDDALHDGDVVAFIPPVAGGSGERVHVRVGAGPIDPRELERLVRSDADGALCTFSGVVRDHHEGRAVERLEYEAYAAMAEGELRRIGAAALERSGASAVALWHRIGALVVGETSVVVSAAAPHRAEAFEACRYAIDTLKSDAPIWKKEWGPGGATWVEDGG